MHIGGVALPGALGDMLVLVRGVSANVISLRATALEMKWRCRHCHTRCLLALLLTLAILIRELEKRIQ